MKRFIIMLATVGFILAAGFSIADEHEGDDEPNVVPVEIYACSYNEGMGPSDLDAVTDKWNAWADEQGMDDYSAWTLTPFYFGPEQDFDVLWLGVAPTAAALGRVQDMWVANGGELQAEFDSVSPCNAHGQFAALNFKEPPEDDEPPSNVVLSFTDCSIADGKDFGDDVAPALTAWAEFRAGHGSAAGQWVFFPVYGGGGEEFDFKFVTGHRTYEEQGNDWDNYDPDKASELFSGLLECDSSRVYNATNRRRAAEDEE